MSKLCVCEAWCEDECACGAWEQNVRPEGTAYDRGFLDGAETARRGDRAELADWLDAKASEYGQKERTSETVDDRRYAQGCLMAFLACRARVGEGQCGTS